MRETGTDSDLIRGGMPKAPRKKLGARGLLLCLLIAGTAIALAVPWAFHIDGSLTLIYWQAMGKLQTRAGTYPLYILIYPASRGSELQGWGSLCISPKANDPFATLRRLSWRVVES